MNSLDLDGKVVFKVKLEKEIKKIVIHNEDINFNELLLMMQRIFSEKIKSNDEFSIKYTDEENDLITLANDSDVSLALQNSKILKLTLFLNEEEETVEELRPAEIVKELKNIRTSIDRFLDNFERSLKLDTKTSQVQKEEMLKEVNGLHLSASNGKTVNNNMIKNDSHKEFDPLTKMQQKTSRAQTPDSINSLELSSSQKRIDSSKQNDDSNTLQHPVQNQFPGNQSSPAHNFSSQKNSSMAPLPHSSIPPQQHTLMSQQAPKQQYPSMTPHQAQPQLAQPQPQHAQPHQQMMPQAPQSYQPQNQHNFPAQGHTNLPQSKPYPHPQFQANLQQPANQENNQQNQQLYQQQQFYQQQQANFQPNQPSQPMQQPPQPMQQPPQSMQQPGIMNPYAKPSNAPALRPPSATNIAYQQGYK